MTIDTDFGEFVFRENISHADCPATDVPAGARIALMERVLSLPLAGELPGAVVTVRGGRSGCRARHREAGEWCPSPKFHPPDLAAIRDPGRAARRR